MGSSVDAGESEMERELFHYTDIPRVRSAAYKCFSKCADFTNERFATLLEEIARGDRVTLDTLLRLWGIRR